MDQPLPRADVTASASPIPQPHSTHRSRGDATIFVTGSRMNSSQIFGISLPLLNACRLPSRVIGGSQGRALPASPTQFFPLPNHL